MGLEKKGAEAQGHRQFESVVHRKVGIRRRAPVRPWIDRVGMGLGTPLDGFESTVARTIRLSSGLDGKQWGRVWVRENRLGAVSQGYKTVQRETINPAGQSYRTNFGAPLAVDRLSRLAGSEAAAFRRQLKPIVPYENKPPHHVRRIACGASTHRPTRDHGRPVGSPRGRRRPLSLSARPDTVEGNP